MCIEDRNKATRIEETRYADEKHSSGIGHPAANTCNTTGYGHRPDRTNPTSPL